MQYDNTVCLFVCLGKGLILHGFRGKKRDLEKKKGYFIKKGIRGSFRVNWQEKRDDSCPGP